MARPALEVAAIFCNHGAAWRAANAGHVSLGQLQVMSAIERCRTAALGGHVEWCEDCGHTRIAYNSCRNRHCPKCQGAAARDWLAERQAELLPVPYSHLVLTLPAAIADVLDVPEMHWPIHTRLGGRQGYSVAVVYLAHAGPTSRLHTSRSGSRRSGSPWMTKVSAPTVS